MIKEKLKKILSINGISILIGIIGGVLGILSIFIDWSQKVSIKWVAGISIVFLFCILILILFSYELYKSNIIKSQKAIKVITFSATNNLILVENNSDLDYSQFVTIFYNVDKLQLLLAKGYVKNIQDKFTQIEIIDFDKEFIQKYPDKYKKLLNNNKESLEAIIIKNYFRYNG